MSYSIIPLPTAHNVFPTLGIYADVRLGDVSILSDQEQNPQMVRRTGYCEFILYVLIRPVIFWFFLAVTYSYCLFS
jgi:hypothetical protein